MSTVKITDLAEITHLNIDTDQTLLVGVDIPSDVTGKISTTTLAEGLYSHNPLKVGNNEILFDHTVGQFSGEDSTYLQVNLQNFNGSGSGDYIVTANTGTNSNSYIDMGINGSVFSDTVYSAMKPYDGYLYTFGPTSTGYQGNLVIGTASSNANIVLIAGGTTSSNIIGTISKNQYSLLNDVYVSGNVQTTDGFVFSDSTRQTTAVSNTWVSANDAVTLTSAKSYTDAANTWIKSNYLANTTGTFNGTLRFTGSVNANGFISIINPSVTDNSVFLKISGAAGGASQPPANPGYTVHTTSIDGIGNRIVADAFGSAANNYSSFIGRRGRGTAASPSALQSGDVITRLSGNGFGATKFSQYGDGRIEIVAAENFTDTSKRTKIDFYTTETGSNSATVIASFNGSNATFNGVVSPQKGFIYTPNVVSSNVTTFGIDIANNAIYKLSCNTTTVNLTLSGFQYGKVVEVWLTNLGGQQSTVNTGCFAINSTKNSATFNLPATSSAYLKYFSINGDLANTFVSIIHP